METTIAQTMQAGVATAWGLLGAAVAARRAHEQSQSGERAKLSGRGWTTGLLAYAGHGEDVARALAARMESAPHLFPNAGAYRHQVARLLADGFWWGPGADTPNTGGADKDVARTEVMLVPGANVYTLLVLAVADAEAMNPRAFGDHNDLARHHQGRAQLTERAEVTLEAVRAIPDVLLLGMAASRDVSLDPRGSLPERLVAATMAGPAAPRTVAPRISADAMVAAR